MTTYPEVSKTTVTSSENMAARELQMVGDNIAIGSQVIELTKR